MLLRRLWDRWELGAWLDRRAAEIPGHYRPSLMVEVWTALLLYGGGWMDDLRLVAARGVRRLFGWEAVPDPTTFGRWLRRAGSTMVGLLDELLWRLVQARWAEAGVPEQVTLAVDSTVRVRYGEKQAGAERGYNHRKPGRPSHHPLLAFLVETGDCMGVRWRPGSAWTGAQAVEWLPKLVDRTAVDDLDGNALLWALGTLAYQMFHGVRTLALSGLWRVAQPDRLLNWLFRLPGRFTDHARKTYLQLRRDEPLRGRLLTALRRLSRLRGPPLPALT